MKNHVCIYGQECWCGATVDTATFSDGRRVHVAGAGGKAGWPRESDALGVLSTQAEDAYNESVAIGVPTEFTKNGRAIIRSEAHQRAYSKALKNTRLGAVHERNCFNF